MDQVYSKIFNLWLINKGYSILVVFDIVDIDLTQKQIYKYTILMSVTKCIIILKIKLIIYHSEKIFAKI